MTPEIARQAQQSHTNLYRFRRLKWGGPPARFKLANVLRAKPHQTPHSKVEAAQEKPVVQFDRAKQTWSLIDLVLLGNIGLSCSVIVLVLLS